MGLIAVFISIFVWSSYNVIYRMDKYEIENMEMTRNLVKGLEQLPEDYKVIFWTMRLPEAPISICSVITIL